MYTLPFNSYQVVCGGISSGVWGSALTTTLSAGVLLYGYESIFPESIENVLPCIAAITFAAGIVGALGGVMIDNSYSEK